MDVREVAGAFTMGTKNLHRTHQCDTAAIGLEDGCSENHFFKTLQETLKVDIRHSNVVILILGGCGRSSVG